MAATPLKVTFRPLAVCDIDLLWAWRQIPQVVRYLPSMPRPLPWEHHEEWCLQALMEQGTKRLDFMAVEGDPDIGRLVAHVHAADLDQDSPEVGVIVGAIDLWGRSIGSQAIQHIVRWLQQQGNHELCLAQIHPDHEASKALFTRQGFIHDPERVGRHGQLVYKRSFREVPKK